MFQLSSKTISVWDFVNQRLLCMHKKIFSVTEVYSCGSCAQKSASESAEAGPVFALCETQSFRLNSQYSIFSNPPLPHFLSTTCLTFWRSLRTFLTCLYCVRQGQAQHVTRLQETLFFTLCMTVPYIVDSEAELEFLLKQAYGCYWLELLENKFR